MLFYVPYCTIGEKTREDGKDQRGASSTKGQGIRTEQNNSYNRLLGEINEVLNFNSCGSRAAMVILILLFFLVPFAEETMRAKQMLATMSHEIRSPLTGVVSMAEILSTSKLD